MTGPSVQVVGPGESAPDAPTAGQDVLQQIHHSSASTSAFSEPQPGLTAHHQYADPPQLQTQTVLTVPDVPTDLSRSPRSCAAAGGSPHSQAHHSPAYNHSHTYSHTYSDTDTDTNSVASNNKAISPIRIPIPGPAPVPVPPPVPVPVPHPLSKSSTHQPRKPSPGLAARLKALGFGSARQSSSPSTPSQVERVGRLPEDQLRLIDQNHQNNSTSLVVQRRGRPWKGAGTPLQLLRSKSSRESFRESFRKKAPSNAAVTTTTAAATTTTATTTTIIPSITTEDIDYDNNNNNYYYYYYDDENDTYYYHDTNSNTDNNDDDYLYYHNQTPSPKPDHLLSTLPEITEVTAPDPVPSSDMDTNKYQLPDHTNGNGTKATPDMRREHLERDSRPPRPEPEPEPEEDTPPPPLPKDTPPGGNTPVEFNNSDLPSYFNPLGLQRAGSIYTISRASFANQLAQLTALTLPDAELLSSKVDAIPTAQAAVRALLGAADQIRSWISKASEVIGGLDSDDDVEWAAAGGREGYEEVENAIIRFEELINVYVTAIEKLQGRQDIAQVSNEDLEKAVAQMEAIMDEWTSMRRTLNNTKSQIETAMEWEELWNMVLGDIQNEMDDLSRLIFEMEERRHKSIMAVSNGDSVDIGDLETIVEETPPTVARNNRYSVPTYPLSPDSPGTPSLNQDDSSLLALFARMQPLRASLDFLPMRLSVFETRASAAFPTACEELEMRRTGLENSYKKLEADADSLRKELGEDKWVLVFRGAGRQAQKMIESVDRSMAKLREGVDQGLHLSNPAVMTKKIESYEAKKMHYGPAIERVLSIIDKGVKDRLTVNGEILRLHTEMQSRWEGMRQQMKEVDMVLEELQTERRGQQLRDSISSMLSNDRSTVASGHETPGSSPPSSVVMANLGLEPVTPSSQSKSRSASIGSHLPQPPSARRSSSSLAPPGRRPLGSRLSMLSNSSNFSTPPRSGSTTPLGTRLPRSSSKLVDKRPRWNTSTNTNDSDVGHNFKPLTLTTPSPYAKSSPDYRDSKLPMRSPIPRGYTSSPAPGDTPSRKSNSRLSFRDSIRERLGTASPGPYSPQMLARSRARPQSQASTVDNRRISLQPPKLHNEPTDIPPRSMSSMATSRRTSFLPQPKSNLTGRYSPHPSGNRKANETKPGSSKPRWHY
ncbi:cortical protein KAR9-domain-containing protein [Camillea tinctor]|nr:cortical protein KAR9-domain-containing protein [Camillea tinctor]